MKRILYHRHRNGKASSVVARRMTNHRHKRAQPCPFLLNTPLLPPQQQYQEPTLAICLGPAGFERAAGLFWINASPLPSHDCHLSLVIANKSSSSSSSKRLVVFTSLAWLTVLAGFAGSSLRPSSEGSLAGLETFQCSLKRRNKFSFVLVKATLQSFLQGTLHHLGSPFISLPVYLTACILATVIWRCSGFAEGLVTFWHTVLIQQNRIVTLCYSCSWQLRSVSTAVTRVGSLSRTWLEPLK